MKSSCYNVFFPLNGEYILFNTFKGPLFLVDSQVKDLLERDEIPLLDEELIEIFKHNGIILDDNVDERNHLALMFNELRYDTTCDFDIITTYACNLACIYCRQKGESNHMDENSAASTVKFIEKVAVNTTGGLVIRLRGGEPLLNMPATLLIARELSEWCREPHRECSLNVVTNGTVLTPENVEDLAKYNCSVSVALDGPREIHDKRRVYQNGKGTFDDIINGLLRASDWNLDITVRITVDETNRDYITSLLEFLKDNSLGSTRISFNPVSSVFPSCKWYDYCARDENGLHMHYQLIDEAQAMGFNVDQPEKPFLNVCHAQKISYFTIDPYLRLFKCFILAPHEKHAVGVIRPERSAPSFNYLNIDFLSRDPLLFEECKTCILVPLCGGGCPAQALETEGTTHRKVCKRPVCYEALKDYFIHSMKRHV